MTEPNDIPAILARNADAMRMFWGPFNVYPYIEDVPNMADEILSLRAQLAALEKDTLRLNDYSTNAHRNIKCGTAGWVYWIPNQGWSMPMPFRDAYDRYAELSRREKENAT